MYHRIVRRLAAANFARVNEHDYDAILSQCVPEVHHRFGGVHALGGERHDVEALRRWFERLGRLCPDMRLTVRDVWVKGLPHDTTNRPRPIAGSTTTSASHPCCPDGPERSSAASTTSTT